MDDLERFMFKNFNIQIGSSTSLVQSSVQKFMDSGIVFVTGTISTFLEIFNFLGLLPIYVFLILMYRTAFKDFCMFVTPIEKHKIVKRVLVQIQKVVQNYIAGLFTVMLIVAILNTTALFIIGVDYAIFFGCFAALLMVIPYLGMFMGALLAALYSLLTKDSPVTCLTIIGSMLFIQFVEGNFITPKITGNKVSINPLAAVLALVAGGFIWGMAGLIISLPVVAMLKVILDNIYSMKHLGFLLGTEIYKGDIQVTRNLKNSRDTK
jgi:predicted PurR-regulated permease PerM